MDSVDADQKSRFVVSDLGLSAPALGFITVSIKGTGLQTCLVALHKRCFSGCCLIIIKAALLAVVYLIF